MYDYWKILQQIHENKHLSLENRQLRDQIRLFQMKINSLADDLERVTTFERKLRIITGLDDPTIQPPLVSPSLNDEMMDDYGTQSPTRDPNNTHEHDHSHDQTLLDAPVNKKPQPMSELNFDNLYTDANFIELKGLYDKKIAANLGFNKRYKITQQWSELIKKSFELSSEYAAFDYKFRKIKEVASKLESNIHKLDQFLLDKSSILKSTPSILPSVGWITSYFGIRISPYSGGRKMHEGLDVGAPFGTPIVAPADGIITFAGHKPGFGNFVQIDHGYGIETIYAHAQKVIAKNGQKIKRGDLIAKVGSTGYSTGPHLHYEVRVNGIAVDPLYFVLDQ